MLQGYTTPASFICPSDPLAIGPSPEYYTLSSPSTAWANFGGLRTLVHYSPPSDSNGNSVIGYHGEGVSYSTAMPWPSPTLPGYGNPISRSPGQWWTTTGANSQVPLVSDMAPTDGGASNPASEADGPGEGTFQRITTTLPTANTFGPYIYNSGNHAGDGQNVGFGDDHVTWEISPYVGQNGDNIFTYHNYPSGGPFVPVNGTTDTNQVGLTWQWDGYVPVQMLAAPFDICMVPKRVVNPKAVTIVGAW